MREIKFRIWNPRHNEYRYWGFIDGIFCGIPTGGGLTIEYCAKNSEQYTNLKDKNGKEIYEGDVLEIENEGQIIAVCEKKPGYFTLVDRAGGEWTRQLFHQPERLSVIGNIHENPELLNCEEEETGNN